METNPWSVSHLGMHVTEDELLEWRKFFAGRKIFVAQELHTDSHSNPVIAGKRWYHYVIFETRHILGVDVKFIVRKQQPMANDIKPGQVVAECLVCGSHKTVEEKFFKGNELCAACNDTTNHTIISK